MAAAKVKIATDTLTLQWHKARFSNSNISSTCQLCNLEPEDMTHFILRCDKLADIRERFLNSLKVLLKEFRKSDLLIHELLNNEDSLMHLIIDCTRYHSLVPKEQVRIETLSRGLCYNLYHKRLLLLANNE